MADMNAYRRYFSRKPHKTPLFCVLTVLLLVIAAMPAVLAWTVHNRPYLRGWDGGLAWMCIAVVLLVGMWIGVRRAHLKLYQLILESPGLDEVGERRLDVALKQSYYLATTGLLGALIAVQTAFIACAKLLGK